MRLFIAIKFNRKMKDHLISMQEDLYAQGFRGNMTKPENMHLTLAFIGDFDDPDQVIEIIDGIRFEPFSLKIEGTGAFGDLWWAGLEKNEALSALEDSGIEDGYVQELSAAGEEEIPAFDGTGI